MNVNERALSLINLIDRAVSMKDAKMYLIHETQAIQLIPSLPLVSNDDDEISQDDMYCHLNTQAQRIMNTMSWEEVMVPSMDGESLYDHAYTDVVKK